MNGKLLIVDDDAGMCELLQTDLSRRGCSVEWRTNAEEGFRALMAEPFDAVVTDLKMPGLNGIDFCHRLAQNRPDVPVIVLTAFGSMETAVDAIRAGAYDFVTKPVELDMLSIVVERALKHRALQQQVRFLKEATKSAWRLERFIGDSAVMKRLFDEVARMAVLDLPALITGESGTGKELVARALHDHSRRHDQPFVALNCAALPEALLESELFGHARGAFTDARSARKGLFQQAHGGTLFLDEIGEIPMTLQPKLLRALEDGSVRPVGEDQPVPCDVRVVTATNRDLESAVEDKRFREDLYFRINVVRVEVPPLRSRGMDVLLLAQHFLEESARRSNHTVSGISPAVADKLLAYHWPGNVRELRNAIERAVALTRFEQLVVDDLPERLRDYRRAEVVFGGHDVEELVDLQEVERRYILYVLETVNGNKSVAARALGLDRKTLYRKLERYGLDPNGQ